jgi:hypothetical protein
MSSSGIKGSGIRDITGFIATEVPKLKQLVQETKELGGVYAKKAALLVGGLNAELRDGIAEIDELERFLNAAEGNGPEDGENQPEVNKTAPSADEAKAEQARQDQLKPEQSAARPTEPSSSEAAEPSPATES